MNNRVAWLGGALVLALIVLIVLCWPDLSETDEGQKSEATRVKTDPEPADEFVHANWDTKAAAPEPKEETDAEAEAAAVPDSLKRLKGVGIAFTVPDKPGKKKKR